MKKLYKSWEWLQNQAKTLETKTIRRHGRSLTFSGIQRMLTDGAVIEVDDKTVILDEDSYRHNKAQTISWLDKEYQREG